MRKMTITATLLAVLFSTTLPTDAQKVFSLNRLVDSVLVARYWRADIDTNYVTRPHTKWTLMGRFNVSGAKISAEGKENGQPFKTEMSANSKATVSVGVSYLGLSLNLSINPAKLFGKYRDYELGFRSYGKRFGFDITYQDAHNFKGWHETEGVRQDITTSEDMFKLKTLNVNSYYVFNSRRFSYPAAFVSSYIQRRSAGSFLLAVSGQGQHGKANITDGDKRSIDFKMTNIALGGGYGYNYVPGSNWLLHISALPTFIVYSHSSLTSGDTKIPLHYHFPEVIITTRAAVVKQIGHKKFAGLSVVYNFTNVGDKDDLSFHNQKWLGRLYFGLRL